MHELGEACGRGEGQKRSWHRPIQREHGLRRESENPRRGGGRRPRRPDIQSEVFPRRNASVGRSEDRPEPQADFRTDGVLPKSRSLRRTPSTPSLPGRSRSTSLAAPVDLTNKVTVAGNTQRSPPVDGRDGSARQSHNHSYRAQSARSCGGAMTCRPVRPRPCAAVARFGSPVFGCALTGTTVRVIRRRQAVLAAQPKPSQADLDAATERNRRLARDLLRTYRRRAMIRSRKCRVTVCHTTRPRARTPRRARRTTRRASARSARAPGEPPSATRLRAGERRERDYPYDCPCWLAQGGGNVEASLSRTAL